MKNKKNLYIIALILGILLFSIGGFHFKTKGSISIGAVFIGVGAGIFGMSLGELIKLRVLKKNPEYNLKIEIEASDERNVFIKNKAKAKAFDLMTTAFGILMLVYTLMNLDLTPILLLVGAYLLVWGCYIVYFTKYYKEM